jgi:hypothetical protein
MSALTVHRPGVRRVGARHLIACTSEKRRLLALDVLKGVNNEGISIGVLGDDDAESCNELFVNIQHDLALQKDESVLSAARALTLCGSSPEASRKGVALVRPNTSARVAEIEVTDQLTGPLGKLEVA